MDFERWMQRLNFSEPDRGSYSFGTRVYSLVTSSLNWNKSPRFAAKRKRNL